MDYGLRRKLRPETDSPRRSTAVRFAEITFPPGCMHPDGRERLLYRPMFEDDGPRALESANILFSSEIDPNVVCEARLVNSLAAHLMGARHGSG